jgi:hypothetical protein
LTDFDGKVIFEIVDEDKEIIDSKKTIEEIIYRASHPWLASSNGATNFT